MKFTLYCRNEAGDTAKLYYDNQTGLLHDEEGKSFGSGTGLKTEYNLPFIPDQERNPIRKSKSPKTLKIQLGLSCNYECEYCLQRFVPHSDEKSLGLVPSFVENLKENIIGEPENIQLWGGEPLVYIKTLYPLVAALKEMYPKARISMITNGSLLNSKTVDWILENDIDVAISHDGPSQRIRGEDPLNNIMTAEPIKRLYWQRKNAGKPISFNTMIHAQNNDRAAVQEWFKKAIGDDEVLIGEGAVIEVYDESAIENSLNTLEDQIAIRTLTHNQLVNREINNFVLVGDRMGSWITSMINGRHQSTLGMKCGVERPDVLIVDLAGNVITCQNGSATATAPNGKPHKGGELNDLAGVKIETATHFSKRQNCSNCPVVQECKGGCMFLFDDLFNRSCNNTYSDHISFFTAAVAEISGWTPLYIEDDAGKLPEERKNIFGLVN
jgi:uncharacterized protein